jgi:hypothetical protein
MRPRNHPAAIVSGFTIVQAGSMDAAAEIAQG